MTTKFKTNRMYVRAYNAHKETLVDFSVQDLEEHTEGLKLDVRALQLDVQCKLDNYKLRDVLRCRTAEYDAAKDALKALKTTQAQLTYKDRLIATTNLLNTLKKDYPNIDWKKYSNDFPNSALEHILKSS